MITNLKLRRKINSLEIEIDKLQHLLRARIVDVVIERYNKIEKYDDLVEENKQLKNKLKKLKELNRKEGIENDS